MRPGLFAPRPSLPAEEQARDFTTKANLMFEIEAVAYSVLKTEIIYCETTYSA